MSETLDTPTARATLPAHETSWEREIGGIHVVFGAGRLAELGALCSALGGREILLVTDPGLVASGHVAAALAALGEAAIEVDVFDGVSPNPTTDEVQAGTEAVRGKSIQLIVALGGGSAMDCAKGINFLLTNGGRMEDYWGFGKAARPMLPAIGDPDDRRHRQRRAVLRPDLPGGQPPQDGLWRPQGSLPHRTARSRLC